MERDQKCVSGDGWLKASKYETLWKICHQLLKKNRVGTTSGRIFVSSAWLKMVHRTAVPRIANTTAGMMRRTRRNQKPLRLIVFVMARSRSSRPVIR